MIVKETSAPRDPIPACLHHAILYAVIDLGTQKPNPKSQYQAGPKREVLFLWELPDERIDVERDGVTRNLPRAASKSFTCSLQEKANLRKFLVGWRGQQFTQAELDGFDLKVLLGQNCMLNVVHNERGYADIVSCSKLMKGAQKRAPENGLINYDIETREVPLNIPEWIRKKIAFSAEHMTPQDAGRHEVPPPHDEDQLGDDDIPF